MALTLETWIPVIGNEDLLNECLWNAFATVDQKVTVIDNGSEFPISKKNRKFDLIRNPVNVGMVESLRQSRDGCTSDLLCFMHSDFMIREAFWDQRVRRYFEDNPRLGLLGAMGAQQADSNGGRSNCFCAFDGSVHGNPCSNGLTPVVLLDGCLMIFRKEAMLDSRVPEQPWPKHHFFDKHVCLQMVKRGWHVAVTDLVCDHYGGRTSNQHECQKSFESDGGEQAIYNSAEMKYINSWKCMFPISVDSQWNYRCKSGSIFDSTSRWFQ